jgi:hypothetical protein
VTPPHRERGRVGRSLIAAGLAACATLCGAHAEASSLVVAKPDGDVHVSSVRVALSTTGTRTIVWEQLYLDATRGDLAWIVAVPPGGWIEAGDPTWFDALEATTAPEISPARSLGCSDPPPREATADPATVGTPRVVDAPLGALSSGAQAIDTLQAAGFLVDASTAARLRDFDTTGEQVLVLKLPAGARGPTRVIRVVGPAGRAFPLALLPAQSTSTPTRGWVFAPVRVRLDGPPNVEPAFEMLKWNAGASNYTTLLAEARAKAPKGFVVPYSSRDGIFADEATGTTGVTLPSLVRRYFGADEGASSDVWNCARLAASDALKPNAVAPWCGTAAAWATTGATPTCPDAPPGAIATSDFACGQKLDLAAAMGGQVPASTWLTRFEVGAVVPAGYPPVDAKLGSIPAFHEAKSLADPSAGCSDPGTPSTPVIPGTPTQPDDAGSANDLPSPPGPSTAEVVDDGCTVAQAFADGCGSSGSSSSCSGSSSDSSGCGSSSSSSSSDSCSGSSSSSDSGCGGSSGSSSSGCGSSGGSSDSGCGSSGGGSSGCSGGGGDSGCTVARGRRVRATGGGYALLALLALARRYGRRAR